MYVCLSVRPETDSSLSGQFLRNGAGGAQAFEKGFPEEGERPFTKREAVSQ